MAFLDYDEQKPALSQWKGYLRVMELLAGLICFAAMADQTGYDKVSEFKFTIAIGVIVFLYSIIMLVIYSNEKKWDPYLTNLPIVELVLDGALVITCLIAGAFAISECEKTIDVYGSEVKRCERTEKPYVSGAFALIAFALYTLSTINNLKQHGFLQSTSGGSNARV